MVCFIVFGCVVAVAFADRCCIFVDRNRLLGHPMLLQIIDAKCTETPKSHSPLLKWTVRFEFVHLVSTYYDNIFFIKKYIFYIWYIIWKCTLFNFTVYSSEWACIVMNTLIGEWTWSQIMLKKFYRMFRKRNRNCRVSTIRLRQILALSLVDWKTKLIAFFNDIKMKR